MGKDSKIGQQATTRCPPFSCKERMRLFYFSAFVRTHNNTAQYGMLDDKTNSFRVRRRCTELRRESLYSPSPPPLPPSLFFSAADFDASSSSSSSSSVESGGCGREIPTQRKRGKRAAVVSECSDSPARLRLDPPREFSAFVRRQIGQFVPRRVTRRTKEKSTSVPSGPIFSLSLL